MFNQSATSSPLAELLRPKNLAELLGQDHILGEKTLIGKQLREGKIPNLILLGPPGCGKTTFARCLSQLQDIYFVSVNAVDCGVKTLRDEAEAGKERRRTFGRQTILFVDEIHRFNKGQQDVLLPSIECGDLILVGATTENPSYELNRALMSRCRVLSFSPLSEDVQISLCKKAFEFYGFDFHKREEMIDSNELEFLVKSADGDGRKLLNVLEILFSGYLKERRKVDHDDLIQALGANPLAYDKTADLHYDLISALIKSVRGSDPQAGVYYLALMLEGGENPEFIARRLLILAAEDIGNADPQALILAQSGFQACQVLGMPESRIILSQIVTYLACTPKSNRSYVAINKASELVKKQRHLSVPSYLRSGANMSGVYRYPHDHPKSWTPQDYLPEEIRGKIFYEPSERGREKILAEYLKWLGTI